MRSGQILGAEALIRWIHPEKGLIPPLDFLPSIEGTELEIQIGDWVNNQALEQIETWEDQGVHLEISVNIASHHLQSESFVEQLTAALEIHSKVKSQQLQLEVLESSALSDLSIISDIIEQCQSELGVSVALDDFGTGYSALTHIRDLSANVIKIDRTFVRDILIDPSDYSIIEGIISLAHAFNHKIIEDYSPNPEWLQYAELAESLSLQDKRRMLIQLTIKHWYSNILFLTESGLTDLKVTRCHLSIWFDRLRNEKLFTESWLDEVKQHHDALFSLARELVKTTQNQQGISHSPSSVDQFKAAYHDLNQLLSPETVPVESKIITATANK